MNEYKEIVLSIDKNNKNNPYEPIGTLPLFYLLGKENLSLWKELTFSSKEIVEKMKSYINESEDKKIKLFSSIESFYYPPHMKYVIFGLVFSLIILGIGKQFSQNYFIEWLQLTIKLTTFFFIVILCILSTRDYLINKQLYGEYYTYNQSKKGKESYITLEFQALIFKVVINYLVALLYIIVFYSKFFNS